MLRITHTLPILLLCGATVGERCIRFSSTQNIFHFVFSWFIACSLAITLFSVQGKHLVFYQTTKVRICEFKISVCVPTRYFKNVFPCSHSEVQG